MSSSDKEYWRKVVREEFKLLMENKMWRLKDLSEGRKGIEGKWVFKRKEVV